jgi:hypothetical protein
MMTNELDVLERFRENLQQLDERAIREAQGRLHQLFATEGSESGHRRSPRRSRRLITVAAAAAALFIGFSAFPPGGPVGIDPVAASQLHEFATIALDSPAEPPPGPGQFAYEKTVSRGLSAFFSSRAGIVFRYSVPVTEERWLGTDGSGRSDSVVGQPTFLTEQDQHAYERYLASGLMADERTTFDWGRSFTDRYSPGELTFFDFSHLPTSVDALKGMIARREIIGGPGGDWETFNIGGDILTWSYAPPELRAALFDLMADLPGVELLGQTRDALGRAGVAVGYTHDGQRQEVVFDRDTGGVLERRWVSVSGNPELPTPEDFCSGPQGACGTGEIAVAGPAGAVSSRTTYKEYGVVVDQMGERPAG